MTQCLFTSMYDIGMSSKIKPIVPQGKITVEHVYPLLCLNHTLSKPQVQSQPVLPT